MTPVAAAPEPVVPGIHRFVLPLWGGELPEVNVYAIENSSELMLVDAGFKGDLARSALIDQLAALGASLADVTSVFITHLHFDHYGLSREFNDVSTQVIALGDPGTGTVFDRRAISADQIREWFSSNGVPLMDLPRWDRFDASGYRAPDVLVEDGTRIEWGRYSLTVVATPGHARGHACLLSADDGFMFSGDHVLEHISPHIGLFADDTGDPLGDYLDSLERVSKLPARLALPGHGRPFGPIQDRTSDLSAHHKSRGEEVLQAVGKGSQKAWDVARNVTWLNDSLGWQQLDAFGRTMAVSETLAHLRHLERKSLVTCTMDGGVFRYSLSDPTLATQ